MRAIEAPVTNARVMTGRTRCAALDAFAGTVLAVSRDRAFLRRFAERVVEVRAGRVRVFPGGYDDYLIRRETQAVQ